MVIMTLEATVLDYHAIVPPPRQLSWAEQHVPAPVMALAQRVGLYQPPAEPAVERKPYPARLEIAMPRIPSSYALPPDNNNPAIHVFDLLETALDRMTFPQGEVRLKLRMDENSWENFCSGLPGSDNSVIEAAMYATFAILDYATKSLGPKGFRVLSAGIGFIHDNSLDLKLQYN